MRQGQQREYADYVASAKRDATKKTRVAGVLPMIQAGVGLNDKYRR
ncbi:MAG: YdeI/OmpD-associated family protein [Woeseiaceae bacterium]